MGLHELFKSRPFVYTLNLCVGLRVSVNHTLPPFANCIFLLRSSFESRWTERSFSARPFYDRSVGHNHLVTEGRVETLEPRPQITIDLNLCVSRCYSFLAIELLKLGNKFIEEKQIEIQKLHFFSELIHCV